MPACVLDLYVDTPIGMDHPVFQAKIQATMDARHAALHGLPLGEAIIGITARMRDLFGDIPGAMVAAQVSIEYAYCMAEGAQE